MKKEINKKNLGIIALWVLLWPVLIIIGGIIDIILYLQTYKLRKNHQFIDVDGSIKSLRKEAI